MATIFRIEEYTKQKASRSKQQAFVGFLFDFLLDFSDGSEICSETLDSLRTTRRYNLEDRNL
jgi:hypothetical protein